MLFREEEIPCPLFAEDIPGNDWLKCLLYHEPMLVPFVEKEGHRDLMGLLHGTITYLRNVLLDNYQNRKGRGAFQASWKTYQAECALEELIYGHSLSPLDYQLSQILGTSAIREKSLTHSRGFLGLDYLNAATSEVSCPPLANWTKDKRNVFRIQRLLHLSETMGAVPSVVGEQLWLILLSDLYQEPVSREAPGMGCHERGKPA